MFTDLFQLEQKPVTVFSSDDVSAPILTGSPGSLKTLLKACLVTGYGDKTALGWQILFESEDLFSAAFVSADPTASKYVLKVDNKDHGYAGTTKLYAYRSMSNIDTGTGQMAAVSSYKTESTSWRLIGHSKAFILLLDSTASKGDDFVCYPIIFGDLPRETKRVEPVVLFWASQQSNVDVASMQSILFKHVNGKLNFNGTGIDGVFGMAFQVNSGQSSANLTKNFCKFSYNSSATAVPLYEPVLSVLPDSTWTMIPMLQPLSVRMNDIGNLGVLSPSAIKVRTGDHRVVTDNGDCVVPTDFWWA